MQQIDFKPLGRRVSRLGLGCARLDGIVDLRRSARLIETALDLGINYFDVAASYGAAEEALGAVLGNSPEVVVATKVGPPRPPYNATRMRLKRVVRPVLDRVRGVKLLLRDSLAAKSPPPAPRPRYDYSREAVLRSVDGSRQRLRRDRLDVFLMHEPNPLDLTDDTRALFDELLACGSVGAYGVGIGAREDRWGPFGSIWQCGWPGEAAEHFRDETAYTFHGVLRYVPTSVSGRTETPVGELLRGALQTRSDSVFLVSASTPDRLRELAESIQELER